VHKSGNDLAWVSDISDLVWSLSVATALLLPIRDRQYLLIRGVEVMEDALYPAATLDIAKKREHLTPEILNAWRAFSRQVFADRALPAKTKDLIAIAVAHVTQCPYCIRAHTKSALAKERPTRRSWKPSGWPPRCGPEAPSRTLRSPSI
jgi:AhpD family alkylhydroperoxidase